MMLPLLDKLNVAITRLVNDSRSVAPGDTFVAYPGEASDGRHYIAQAIARGANAVIWEAQHFSWDPAWNIPNLMVSDLRHKAGWLADSVYGTPSSRLWMVGITGTNGKTSTCHWICTALNAAGKKCALLGTLGNGFPDTLQPSNNTTPGALSVHRLLNDYVNAGAAAVAMEVSSHALAQGRVNGVRFDVALLTNLSRDHLDYHGDMQSYAASKHRLFVSQDLKYIVLNLDDTFGAELAEQDHDAEIIAYGLTDDALKLAERLGMRMVYGALTKMSGQGLTLDIKSSWGSAKLDSTLIGKFNAENLLGALAVLLVSDLELKDAVQSLCEVQAVAGRMQRLGGKDQPTVIVDYAHTPDALEKVLLALREVLQTTEGRLICVFGCGGDRDRGKRPMMGLVAEKFSDLCIVTSDNPRSEDPQQIIAGILGGMTIQNHEVIVNRASAIEYAITQAQPEDIVLLAGKGHEDYQEIKGVKHPFSDVSIAEIALQKWSAGAAL
jgi:UDP-N-acetylmuramoyl-L-alanyl-D-glutamate--2,6-diaminopimelate ligase